MGVCVRYMGCGRRDRQGVLIGVGQKPFPGKWCILHKISIACDKKHAPLDFWGEYIVLYCPQSNKKAAIEKAKCQYRQHQDHPSEAAVRRHQIAADPKYNLLPQDNYYNLQPITNIPNTSSSHMTNIPWLWRVRIEVNFLGNYTWVLMF